MGASDVNLNAFLPPGTPGPLSDADELDRYAANVAAFLAGAIADDRFTAMRLQQGCYGQRQPGVHMLRVKAPGGRLVPAQLIALADVLETWSQTDHVHVTTRQSVQLHYVPTAATPAAMRRLAEAGLTTREACNNTVRNVTACTLAGVCPREHTDVTAHLDAAVHYFLRNPLNQQMPRKFKVSFSGCESDCAQGMVHDLGVIATRRGDVPGFKLVAAGGLGHKPREAIVIADFIVEHELIPAMEAVITLHEKYSDRSKRAKSRIKFLVERFGGDGFVARFNDEFARCRAAHAADPVPLFAWRTPTEGTPPGAGAPRARSPQRQAGLVTVPVSVRLGHLTGAHLRGLSALMLANELDDIRTTQDQNLVLRNVPQTAVDSIVAGLQTIGFGLPQPGDNVVACPGTTTCRLGITSSQGMGARLAGVAGELRVRVSGCHNGCAQPETGDIGIYGEGRRLHDRLVPHYQLYLGGDGMAGGRLARKGPSIPVARIEKAIARLVDTHRREARDGERFFDWTHRQADDYFTVLFADLTAVAADEMDEVLRDVDGSADFKVAQLGGGECAGAVQVFIGAAFFAAAHERRYRDAFAAQRCDADARACASAQLRLIGQGVHDLVNPAPSFRVRRIMLDLAEIADALGGKVPDDMALAYADFARVLAGDDTQPVDPALYAEIDRWVVATAQFCVELDPQLDLTGALPVAAIPSPIRFMA
ncbi:MAG: nitrite/sulfite reductase, partial [Casimicrobiaceae bacterium]